MLLFGLVVHVAVVGAFQLLPAPVVQRINEMVALPFIAIFTVATLLLGTALKDLEERLATDRALSDSSARLRAITQAIPDVLLVLDRNGRYQEVLSNDKAALVANANDLLGKHLSDVLPADQAQRYLELIDRKSVV